MGSSGSLHSRSFRRSAFSPRSSPPFPARSCSATARWSWRRSGSASSPSWSGCITSSPWAQAPTSTRSSASCRRSSRYRPAQSLQLAVHDLLHHRIVFTPTPMSAVRFIVTFVIRGMTGVLLAVPAPSSRHAFACNGVQDPARIQSTPRLQLLRRTQSGRR